MAEKMQKAICDGTLNIGDAELPCAVLEDGTRLLNQAETLEALGRSRRAKGGSGAVDELPPFLAAKNLEPFIDEELRRSTTPVIFRPLKGLHRCQKNPLWQMPRRRGFGERKMATDSRAELLNAMIAHQPRILAMTRSVASRPRTLRNIM